MIHHHESSVKGNSCNLFLLLQDQAATGFWSNRIVSDVLGHCLKIISVLLIICFNHPYVISMQLIPVAEHQTQYILKYLCLSNK
jgi:hypothetical protein